MHFVFFYKIVKTTTITTTTESSKKKPSFSFGKPITIPKKNSLPNTNGALEIKSSAFKGFASIDEEDEPKPSMLTKFGKKATNLEKLINSPSTTPTKETSTTGEKETTATEEPSQDMMEIDEIDPLDLFMEDVSTKVSVLQKEDAIQLEKQKAQMIEHIDSDSETEPIQQEEEEQDIFKAAEKLLAATKKKDIIPVDHSTIDYPPFRKDFFVEPLDSKNMSEEALKEKRMELDGIKIRGLNAPKPIEKWNQFGLPVNVFEVIRKILRYERPSPIQAQAIPAILSGRDVIGNIIY